MPGAKELPLTNTPLLLSALSNALLSAFHQLTKPDGDVAQGGSTSVTDTLSSNTSTPAVAEEVSVKVNVEFVVVAVNVNVCDGP